MPSIRQVAYFGGHRYTVEGDERVDPSLPLPTISTIAQHADSGGGDGLLYWAVDAYIETGIRNAFGAKRDEAVSIGTDLHGSIDEYIATGEQPSNPSPLFGAWYSSLHEAGVEWYASEIMVYDPRGYGGTVDAIGYLEGVPTLFDWKTTDELDKRGKRKKINSPTHATQVGGYSTAIETMGERYPELPQPVQAYVVYVFKDTLQVEWKRVDLPRAKQVYHAAFTIYSTTKSKGGLYEGPRKESS